jgi:tetratricopeptide (TPR) repeat protein
MMNDFQNELKVARRGVSILEQYHLDTDKFASFCLGHPLFHLKKDSAEYYLLRGIGHSIYTDMAIYQDLGNLYQSEFRYEEACEYFSKQCVAMDSIHKLDKHKTLIEMRQKYEQDSLIKENKLLNERETVTVQRYLFISCLLLFIIFILCLFYNSRRKRIKRNEERIQELTSLLGHHTEMQGKMEEYNQSLIQQAHTSNLQLSEINQSLNRLRKREMSLLNQLVCKDEVLARFMKADHFADEDEWVRVRKRVDVIFNNFTVRLSEKIPTLTMQDINICCLIKLYITNKEAADIMGISAMSVAKHKLRIKEKIVNVVGFMGEGKSLDIWLREF